MPHFPTAGLWKQESDLRGGTSLMVQWVRLRTPIAGGPGSIPGRATRSHMHAATKNPACRN